MVRLENLLKISLQQNVLKTSWRHLEEVVKTFWRRLEDVLKTSCKRLEDVLKTSWGRLKDIWPRQIYWSWPRRLEDVFWRRKAKANIFILFKTSSEDEDERRLQDVFIKTNVCWEVSLSLHFPTNYSLITFFVQGSTFIAFCQFLT